MSPSQSTWAVSRATLAAALLSAAAFAAPSKSYGEILWSGDFETGDFMQWPLLNRSAPNLSQIPPYCRPTGPTSYYGDGSCLSLDTDIVRQGKYSAKFTIKNSQNGWEPRDCDPAGNNCTRRRSVLTAQLTLPDLHNAMPYMSERWVSVSLYVPKDWDDGGGGWAPSVFGIKPRNENGLSGVFAIHIENGSWVLWHRWTDQQNPTKDQIPWQQQMFYTATYPAADGSDSGRDLRADFPNQAASQRALGNLNKGGWTDFVARIRFDARGSRAGGNGLLEVYKREDNGEWLQVLDIRPRVISRGNMTFDRGIGSNSPATGSNNGGFGIKAGLYMHKDQVWNRPNNRVLYIDNIKVGSQNASFSEMSPDASAPGQSAPDQPDGRDRSEAVTLTPGARVTGVGHGRWDANSYTLTTIGEDGQHGRIHVDVPTVPGQQYTVNLTYDVNLNAPGVNFRTQMWDMPSTGGYGSTLHVSPALATGVTTRTVDWMHTFVAEGEVTRIAGQYTGVAGNSGSSMRLVRTEVYGPQSGGNTDSGNTDSGNTDNGNTDNGNTDSGNTDNGNTDSGNTDSGNTDSGNTDSGAEPVETFPNWFSRLLRRWL